MNKSRTTVIANSREMDDMLLAIEEAVTEYKETHKQDPEFIWMHRDWQEDEENFESLLEELEGYGLSAIFNDDILAMEEIEVGIEEAKEQSPVKSEIKIGAMPTNGNMWTQVDFYPPTPPNLIKAVLKAKGKFLEHTAIAPTSVSVHVAYEAVREEIAVGTGLEVLLNDPAIGYPSWALVGIPTVNNRSITVESTSGIDSIAYYPRGEVEDDGQELGVLLVVFNRRDKSQVTYQYLDVPNGVYQAMLDAQSKGAFLNEEIKNKYEYDIIS